jgi:hypothetical protein
MALSYPLINGLRYDYTSLEAKINGQAYDWTAGLKELSFSDELEPGEVYGTFAQSLGATRGQYKAEGSFTLYFQEAQEFIAVMSGSDGTGYMETYFDLQLSYSEASQTLVTVELLACRIKKAEDSQSQGSDPLETKFDLRVGMVKRNGKYPVSKVRK